ncbi:MMPL family transporter [Cellulomonas soli]
MSSVLYRLGRAVFRARRRVALLWLAVVVVMAAGAGLLNQGTDNTFSIPGTESGEALAQLSRTFPQVSGTSASLVVVAPDGQDVHEDAVRGPVATAVTALGAVDGVEAVTDPYGDLVTGTISDDGQALVVTLQVAGQSNTVSTELLDSVSSIADTLEAALPDGSQLSLGGDLYGNQVPTVSVTEGLGVVIALVVLVITFGSFLAAGMPLLTALLGVALSMSAIYLATAVATISSTTPLLALMLGLAVGIDYALFIISRHQGQLRAGMDPEESTARALATAGSAVVFAGLTVMIALVGLAVARIPFLTVMGVAAAVGVGIAVVIALTLTPALLGFAGSGCAPGTGVSVARAAPPDDAPPLPTARHGPPPQPCPTTARHCPPTIGTTPSSPPRATTGSSSAGCGPSPGGRSSRSCWSSWASARSPCPRATCGSRCPTPGRSPKARPRASRTTCSPSTSAPATTGRSSSPPRSSARPTRSASWPTSRTRSRGWTASPPCPWPPRTRTPTPASCRSSPRAARTRRPPSASCRTSATGTTSSRSATASTSP